MALKRTSVEVPFVRQDVHGKPLEFGELIVESVNGEVSLIFVGERRVKYYVVSREAWDILRQI